MPRGGSSRSGAVQRYLRRGVAAEVQVRPEARALDEDEMKKAVELLDGPAAGNAVVVRTLLEADGVRL